MGLDVSLLPPLNALLNATATVLLVAGYACIKIGRQTAHSRLMRTAFGVSILFLISYLSYRVVHPQHTHYGGPAPWRRFTP